VWLVALTIAGGLAPVVWGDAAWGAGLVAGIASFAVGLLVLWLLYVIEAAIAGAVIGIATYSFTFLRRRRSPAA